MIEVEGDLWEYGNWAARGGHLLVIPTNIGWRWDGQNVMGAGLAKEAVKRWGYGVAKWYGGVCRAFGEDTPVVRYFRSPLLLFPTKPLRRGDPSRSWMQESSLELVARSTRQLAAWHEMSGWQEGIAVPFLPGCGNGKLPEAWVYPILRRWLGDDDRFVLVRRRA
ncbi:MAG: hypothetical protein ACRD1Z_20010 [Vicinamibacteria bacterium]